MLLCSIAKLEFFAQLISFVNAFNVFEYCLGYVIRLLILKFSPIDKAISLKPSIFKIKSNLKLFKIK